MGIELSEGAGKGTNVHDVISGLRTFPIVEKPLVATGGPDEVNDTGGEVNEYPRDVDEGPVGSEENSDGKEDREDGPDTRLLAGGPMTDGSELELWAPTLPMRVNKEHSVEKDDARNMVGGATQSRTVTRALDVIIYAAVIACLPSGSSHLFAASRRLGESSVQYGRACTFRWKDAWKLEKQVHQKKVAGYHRNRKDFAMDSSTRWKGP